MENNEDISTLIFHLPWIKILTIKYIILTSTTA